MNLHLKRKRPEFLKRGDIWYHGNDDKLPWIFVSGETFKEIELTVWRLSWFGKKSASDSGPILITDTWTGDSSFAVEELQRDAEEN